MKVFLCTCMLFLTTISLHAQSWTAVGALNANDYIAALATDPAGNVYAAGAFTSSSKRVVSKWNGTAWSVLGTGSGALNANNNILTIAIDSAGNVYAAGSFTNSSNKRYVAKWNGIGWSELGTGTNALGANNNINSIAIDGAGNVYAAGNFTNSSNKRYVAKWNGSSWSEVGTGTNALGANGAIQCIKTGSAGNIYAAGSFYNSSGDYYVAKWNGTSWAEMGTGANALAANDYIYTLAVDASENVYAGGYFYDASWSCYVAKWNGTSWAALGTLNADDAIRSIALDPFGNVYAAGYFTNSSWDYYVACWNGSTWSELGSGTGALQANDYIRALVMDTSGNLFAGGYFTNSNYRAYVAKYNTACSGSPAAGTAIAAAGLLTCNTSTTLSLSGNTSGRGIHYQWQYNTGGGWTNFGSGTDTTTTPSITRLTEFRCVVSCLSPGGGSDTSAIASAGPLPLPVNLGNDRNVCLHTGEKITLDAGTFPNNPVYLWNDGASGQQKDIDQTGTYSVKVTDQYSCMGSDTLKITVRASPVVSLGDDTTVCNGASLTFDAGPGNVSYFWNTGQSTQTITANNSGTYIAFVTNSEGCMGSDTIVVTMTGELPTIQGINVTNDGAYTFKFTPVTPMNVIAYEWDFGDGTPLSNLATPTHTFATDGNYVVTLKLNSSCGSRIDSTSAQILGLNQIDVDASELMIYPNPSKGKAAIFSKHLAMENISIYNSAAQLMLMVQPDNRYNCTLQLSSLIPGTYIVRIRTKQGYVIRKLQVL